MSEIQLNSSDDYLGGGLLLLCSKMLWLELIPYQEVAMYWELQLFSNTNTIQSLYAFKGGDGMIVHTNEQTNESTK